MSPTSSSRRPRAPASMDHSARRSKRQRMSVAEDPVPVVVLDSDHAVEALSERLAGVLERDQRTVPVRVLESRGASAPRTRTYSTSPSTSRTQSRTHSHSLSRTAPVSQCLSDLTSVSECSRRPSASARRTPTTSDRKCSDSSSRTAVPQQCFAKRIRPSRSSTSTTSTSRWSWVPAGSAIRWIVAALCVLALLPPRSMAAPAPAPAPAPRSPRSPSHPRPKWVNPCGMNKQDQGSMDPDQELELLNVPAVTVTDLMQQIVVSAKNALDHAKEFRDDYVKHTFDISFDDHHKSWQTYKYDWLPAIPKQLGEKVRHDHLQKQNLEHSLKDIYQFLQKYAVGLEQVVWDQREDGGEYSSQFKDMEYRLRSVLCEVQVAMAEQSVLQHPDVSRDIMSEEFRDMKNNASYRHLRDWIILRDYMNGLEYVIQLFEHFTRPTPAPASVAAP